MGDKLTRCPSHRAPGSGRAGPRPAIHRHPQRRYAQAEDPRDRRHAGRLGARVAAPGRSHHRAVGPAVDGIPVQIPPRTDTEISARLPAGGGNEYSLPPDPETVLTCFDLNLTRPTYGAIPRSTPICYPPNPLEAFPIYALIHATDTAVAQRGDEIPPRAPFPVIGDTSGRPCVRAHSPTQWTTKDAPSVTWAFSAEMPEPNATVGNSAPCMPRRCTRPARYRPSPTLACCGCARCRQPRRNRHSRDSRFAPTPPSHQLLFSYRSVPHRGRSCRAEAGDQQEVRTVA